MQTCSIRSATASNSGGRLREPTWLKPEATRQFIETAFRDGVMQSTGTGIAITKVLPAMSRFAGGGAHSAKKQSVLDKLSAFVVRFLGLA